MSACLLDHRIDLRSFGNRQVIIEPGRKGILCERRFGFTQLRKETVVFFLAACKATAELALKRREDAARSLHQAQEFADKHDYDHYSSDILLSTGWRLIDSLRADGLGNPQEERIIRVQCEHCHARVRGTSKKVDDLVACPACKTAPFRYFVDA